MDMVVPGHEKNCVSLSWTLYDLAKYPKIQEKMRKEAKIVLGEGMYRLPVDAKLKVARKHTISKERVCSTFC